LWTVQGGRFGPKEYDFVVNPLAALPASLRIPNAIRITWRYIGLLIYPATLSCDYSYNSIPLYATWRHFIPAVLATAVALAVWIWALATSRRPWFLAGAIYLAGFAITGNILMAAGPPMGERIAYLPSAGFCLFAALLWAALDKRWPKTAGVLLLIAVVALAARTWVRNRDWQDNATLFFAGVRAEPNSVKMQDFVIAQYMARGDWNAARARSELLLQMYPPFPDELKSAGIAEYDFRLVKEAERQLQAGESDDALAFVNVVIKRSPRFSLAWSERAAIRYEMGDMADARRDAQNALRLDPANLEAQELLKSFGSVQ